MINIALQLLPKYAIPFLLQLRLEYFLLLVPIVVGGLLPSELFGVLELLKFVHVGESLLVRIVGVDFIIADSLEASRW